MAISNKIMTENVSIEPPRSDELPRLLVFIVAYQAEETIKKVLARIPASLAKDFVVDVLIIDDGSTDRTFERSEEAKTGNTLPFSVNVLVNPKNQGYGGNQKIGYHYAIERGYDLVALLHGDGQYAPECLPDLVQPLRDGLADAVFGSRMIKKGAARQGGMPLYKFWGNKFLTWLENRILRTQFSEFHSGYRVYSVSALKNVPFDRNTNNFHFDTEIIIQFVFAKLRILELPIPTYYGKEICRVNGIPYAWNVLKAVLKARSQKLGIFYDRRFDCLPNMSPDQNYEIKLDFRSPHSEALTRIKPGSRVLELGCASGSLGENLQKLLGCRVTGVDEFPLKPGVEIDHFICHDLNQGLPPINLEDFDYILLLDVIEHLTAPEQFVEYLREALAEAPTVKIMVSSGNIGFFIIRIMLLLGQFNYGRRGILDLTHSRLFTFASLRRLFEQGGFDIRSMMGIPGPYPLALGNNNLSRAIFRTNDMLIGISPGLFSYQIFLELQPQPTLKYLLTCAMKATTSKSSKESLGIVQ